MTVSAGLLLTVAAIILFVIFALGVDTDVVHLGWIGLGCYAAGRIVP